MKRVTLNDAKLLLSVSRDGPIKREGKILPAGKSSVRTRPPLGDNVKEREDCYARAESLMAAPWGLKDRHTVSQQAAAIKIVLEDRTFNLNARTP